MKTIYLTAKPMFLPPPFSVHLLWVPHSDGMFSPYDRNFWISVIHFITNENSFFLFILGAKRKSQSSAKFYVQGLPLYYNFSIIVLYLFLQHFYTLLPSDDGSSFKPYFCFLSCLSEVTPNILQIGKVLIQMFVLSCHTCVLEKPHIQHNNALKRIAVSGVK